MTSTIIAVDGIHARIKKGEVVRAIARRVQCKFELLNFETMSQVQKRCYLRIPPSVDYNRIIHIINKTPFNSRMKLHAYLPNKLPDATLNVKNVKKVPTKLQRQLRILEEPPSQVLKVVTEEMLVELQYKYPGLYEYNKNFDCRPLKEMKRLYTNRLNEVTNSNKAVSTSTFQLSEAYRKKWPHSGDFKLLLEIIHMMEDEAKVPRSEITENNFMTVPKLCAGENYSLPLENIDPVCTKFSSILTESMCEHVDNLDTEQNQEDSEEDKARKKVRAVISDMSPFLSQFVSEMVTRTLAPMRPKNPKHTNMQTGLNMRIYGEPFLPSKEVMKPFLKQFAATRVVRVTRLHNMLWFKAAYKQYAKLMSFDNKSLAGAKLIVRSSDIPIFSVLQKKSKIGAVDFVPSHPTETETTAPEQTAAEQWGVVDAIDEQDFTEDVHDQYDDAPMEVAGGEQNWVEDVQGDEGLGDDGQGDGNQGDEGLGDGCQGDEGLGDGDQGDEGQGDGDQGVEGQGDGDQGVEGQDVGNWAEHVEAEM